MRTGETFDPEAYFFLLLKWSIYEIDLHFVKKIILGSLKKIVIKNLRVLTRFLNDFTYLNNISI